VRKEKRLVKKSVGLSWSSATELCHRFSAPCSNTTSSQVYDIKIILKITVIYTDSAVLIILNP
jgi:hypothetical protein